MLSPSLIAKQQAEIAAQMEQQATFMIGYQICTALVTDTLQSVDPRLLEYRTNADCWVVEAGTGDVRLHSLLDAMKIPHKSIAAEQLPLIKLYPNQTLFINCSNDVRFFEGGERGWDKPHHLHMRNQRDKEYFCLSYGEIFFFFYVDIYGCSGRRVSEESGGLCE